MEELVNRVSEKTGLPQEQAQSAANAVIEFLKERLPAPVGAALSSFTGGSEGGDATGGLMGQAQNLTGGFGGFGGGN
ncbi:MAG: hypothetical protein H7Z37_03870 [Pyrinomonadaceae bacterium]|nr:hypothetical protein [Pyrinomonadaceae bacterium]